MHTMITIPCLNEQDNIEATCSSLGFGYGLQLPYDTTLILVDNGSTDDTTKVMANIRNIAPNQVTVVHEPEQGYVPARHRGVLVAIELARKRHYSLSDVLILQADADTIYNNGYVEAMRKVANAHSNTIIEGLAHTTTEFLDAHKAFHSLAKGVDSTIAHLFVDESDEVIIDDKVAAYKLEDYLVWGGHRREYNHSGDEIFAETSRLFLRGKMMGAKRIRAGDALAFPSRRKVELDPVLYFATAGFPREITWCKQWNASQRTHFHLNEFEMHVADNFFPEAIYMRLAHSLVLFGLMPIYVAKILGNSTNHEILKSPLGVLLQSFPEITGEIIKNSPGHLFECLLSLIETHRTIFEACLEKIYVAGKY